MKFYKGKIEDILSRKKNEILINRIEELQETIKTQEEMIKVFNNSAHNFQKESPKFTFFDENQRNNFLLSQNSPEFNKNIIFTNMLENKAIFKDSNKRDLTNIQEQSFNEFSMNNGEK